MFGLCAVAAKIAGKNGDPDEAWRKLKETHPPAGKLVSEAAAQVKASAQKLTDEQRDFADTIRSARENAPAPPR